MLQVDFLVIQATYVLQRNLKLKMYLILKSVHVLFLKWYVVVA